MWIAKDYESPTHEVAFDRERVIVNGEYRWQAKTLCGRTVTGRSGGSVFPPDCRACQRAIAKLEAT